MLVLDVQVKFIDEETGLFTCVFVDDIFAFARIARLLRVAVDAHNDAVESLKSFCHLSDCRGNHRNLEKGPPAPA